ncbi:MAG TPA: hypothetical protein VGI82_09990, partial [Chitinophagaceae bacterium]
MKKTVLPQLLKVLFALSIPCIAFSQNGLRTLPAKRTNLPVKIDGLLNDSAWKDAAMMTDLVEFRPKIGAREEHANRTES